MSRKTINAIDLLEHDFREIIQARLEALGKNVYWLAMRSGSSRSIVYRFMSGKADTTSQNIRDMLCAVGIELNVTAGFKPED